MASTTTAKKAKRNIINKIEEMNGKGEYDLLCIVFVLTVGLSLSSELFGFLIERFSRHSRHSNENTQFHGEEWKE